MFLVRFYFLIDGPIWISINKPPNQRPAGDPQTPPAGASEQGARGKWPSFQESGPSQAAGWGRVGGPWSPHAHLLHVGDEHAASFPARSHCWVKPRGTSFPAVFSTRRRAISL